MCYAGSKRKLTPHTRVCEITRASGKLRDKNPVLILPRRPVFQNVDSTFCAGQSDSTAPSSLMHSD